MGKGMSGNNSQKLFIWWESDCLNQQTVSVTPRTGLKTVSVDVAGRLF